MMTQSRLLVLLLTTLAGLTSAAPASGRVTTCKEQQGVQNYADPSSCTRYIRCENGTLSEEECASGLVFTEKRGILESCDYYWRVDCGSRPFELGKKSRGACPYQYGIFPTGTCLDYFVRCVNGTENLGLCPLGQAFDRRSRGCNWPDLVPECGKEDAEKLAHFSCPEVIPVGSASLRFGPQPRFSVGKCDRMVICVNYFPRLTLCPLGTMMDEGSLTCVDASLVPACAKGANAK